MKRLFRRVAAQPSSYQRAQAQLTPVQATTRQTANVTPTPAVTGGQASPGGTPMTMPTAAVVAYPNSGEYVTLGYTDVQPLFTSGPSGGAIAATAPGRWGKLAAAGRPNSGALTASRAPIAGRHQPAA